MRRWLAVLLPAAAVLAGLALCWAGQVVSQPHCPTEDSCTVDYRDGHWHVTEVTP